MLTISAQMQTTASSFLSQGGDYSLQLTSSLSYHINPSVICI